MVMRFCLQNLEKNAASVKHLTHSDLRVMKIRVQQYDRKRQNVDGILILYFG